MVKNPPANAGDIRDGGSIPGWGRSPGGGMATHSSILAWRIPWIEEPIAKSQTRLSDLAHTHVFISGQRCSAAIQSTGFKPRY